MIHQKAIVYGVLAFIGLYTAHLLIVPFFAGLLGKGGAILGLLSQLLGIAALLIPGFLAGRLAGERGFTHGCIVGALGTLASALVAFVVSVFAGSEFLVGIHSLFRLLLNSMLSGFGGMLGENPNWYRMQ